MRWIRSALVIRNVLAGAVATAAVAGAGITAFATPSQQTADLNTSDLKTVPFEVSGELPIYPKALWSNGSSGADVR